MFTSISINHSAKVRLSKFESNRILFIFRFTLYIIITLFVCTMVSTVALFIGCPWEANDWKEGDEHRLPMCSKDGWVGLKFGKWIVLTT